MTISPSNTGKSTLLNLPRELAGKNLRSATSLDQLSDQAARAVARAVDKALIVAGDHDAMHLAILAAIKQITSGEEVYFDRKYGLDGESPINAALMFSVNKIPTVGEDSLAFDNRISLFLLNEIITSPDDSSSAKSPESRLLAELPRIAARWVRARRRFYAGGGRYTPNPQHVADYLSMKSDRVALWLRSCCITGVTTDVENELMSKAYRKWESGLAGDGKFAVGLSRPSLDEAREAMAEWARSQGFGALNEDRFVDRLVNKLGVKKVLVGPKRWRRLDIAIKPRAEWGDALLDDLTGDASDAPARPVDCETRFEAASGRLTVMLPDGRLVVAILPPDGAAPTIGVTEAMPEPTPTPSAPKPEPAPARFGSVPAPAPKSTSRYLQPNPWKKN